MFSYCKRGVTAGSIAGMGYGTLMAAVGNPLTRYVDAVAHHDHSHEAAPVVSETTTALVGIGSGVLWGIFLGAAFGVVYYLLEPSLPGTEGTRPYVLAGAGFLTVSVAPWLALPPTAPGMEQQLTTTPRLVLYGGMMLAGGALAVFGIGVYTKLAPRRRVAGGLVGLAPIVVAIAVVPQLTPAAASAGDLPGTLVVTYQGMIVSSQAGLWLVLAGGYSWLARTGRFSRDTPVVETGQPLET